jgi:ABC-2 type transport system ATP-binding protein
MIADKKNVAIAVNQLSKRYHRVAALAGLDLEVQSGEIMGLIGPDGAGKSTALRIMAGVVGPDGGTIMISGHNVTEAFEEAKFLIGYMPQKFSLYTDLTVRENMDFFATVYGVGKQAYRERYEELMSFSRLRTHEGKLAGALSGGMQKKLALSCNLLHRPQVLLLDEPTNGVDPVSRRELWALLYDLKAQGTTILVTTPYMDEAERCDRVTFVDGGAALACDTPENLMRKAAAAGGEMSGFGAVFSHLLAQHKEMKEKQSERH